MSEATVDDKGRILLPKKIRESMELGSGRKVRLSVEGKRLIISAPVSPDEFVEEMRGFIKEGSVITRKNPIELKRIWETQ